MFRERFSYLKLIESFAPFHEAFFNFCKDMVVHLPFSSFIPIFHPNLSVHYLLGVFLAMIKTRSIFVIDNADSKTIIDNLPNSPLELKRKGIYIYSPYCTQLFRG